MVDLTIARKHIESLYFGTFSAIERVKIKDPTTGLTNFIEQTYIENEKCKLSFKSLPPTGEGTNSSLFLSTKLSFRPTVILKEGSKVIVNQNGAEYVLKNTGVVRVGINHNEAEMEAWDNWA